MIELLKEQIECIKDFYRDCNDTTVWACLQGIMGRAWVDQYPNPTVSRIIQGDFCFPAGYTASPKVNQIFEDYPPEINQEELIIIPHNKEWDEVFQNSGLFNRIIRYSIKKEGFIFDEDKLRSFINSLSDIYEIKQIDEELYHISQNEYWSRDFCLCYGSADEFMVRGIGFVILHNQKIVCGASSYSSYKEGIEVEIATKPEYRKQGLATICGARLILECMKLNKYPSWDAANLYSVKIAQKLGYHFDKEYSAYKRNKEKDQIGGSNYVRIHNRYIRHFIINHYPSGFFNFIKCYITPKGFGI